MKMNQRQRRIGWAFVLILAVLLLPVGPLILPVALIGLWWFLAAGSTRPQIADANKPALQRLDWKWTGGMIGAIEEAKHKIREMPSADQDAAAWATAIAMADTWSDQWLEDWARSQPIPYATIVAEGRRLEAQPGSDPSDSDGIRRSFVVAVSLSILADIS